MLKVQILVKTFVQYMEGYFVDVIEFLLIAIVEKQRDSHSILLWKNFNELTTIALQKIPVYWSMDNKGVEMNMKL